MYNISLAIACILEIVKCSNEVEKNNYHFFYAHILNLYYIY